MADTTTLLDGLCFPEGPRWHDGRLWFSDMHAQRVMAVTPAGSAEVIVETRDWPSGLGWLPDGQLLIVAMRERKLLRFDGHATTEHADLAALASWHCNDMVVDANGRAYVGNFGFDLHAGAGMKPAEILVVEPDGRAALAADDLGFPNGTVITPDGRTLIVAESFAGRLTAFDIAADGALSGRRVWARCPQGVVPDGICLDAEGAIWLASPTSNECIRMREGGEVTDRVGVDRGAFACMLGGPEGTTLFVATAESSDPDECRRLTSGRIETCAVAVPGAGLP